MQLAINHFHNKAESESYQVKVSLFSNSCKQLELSDCCDQPGKNLFNMESCIVYLETQACNTYRLFQKNVELGGAVD